MPTQMPKKGLPLDLHCLDQRLGHAVDRLQAAFAVGEGTDAGQHDAVGRSDPHPGSAVTRRRGAWAWARAARSNAFSAERRLPDP
jgi:hypothetical protein